MEKECRGNKIIKITGAKKPIVDTSLELIKTLSSISAALFVVRGLLSRTADQNKNRSQQIGPPAAAMPDLSFTQR